MELLRSAHLDLEGLVLDREVRSLRDQFVTSNFSKLLYNGLWFSAERELYVVLFFGFPFAVFPFTASPRARAEKLLTAKQPLHESCSKPEGRQRDCEMQSLQGEDDNSGTQLEYRNTVRCEREQYG